MTTPLRHRSKSRQNKRRLHVFTKPARLAVCPKCSKRSLPHRVCVHCGFYKGKEMVNVMAKLDKAAKKSKEKEIKQAEMGT